MTLTDQALFTQARRAYEWARLRRAVAGVLPLVLLVAGSAALGARPGVSMAVGAVLLAYGVFSLWRGLGIQRALMPGIAAGLAPLVFVTCAARMDLASHSAACHSVCLAASLLGGGAAGFFVGRWVALRAASLAVAGAAAIAALLTGSLACSCVGADAVVALTAAFLVTAPLAWVLSNIFDSPKEH